MAFSYSVRKVQLGEVSGNLLKTWCAFLEFLGGTVLLWEVEGGAPTSVSPSALQYGRSSFISIHLAAVLGGSLSGQSERGPLSITTSCGHKTGLREMQ